MSLYIDPRIYLGPGWRPIVVDNVRTRVVINDNARYENYRNLLWKVNAHHKALEVNTKIVYEQYSTALVWKPKNCGKAIACVKMGINYNQKYLSLSLFPSNGNREQLVHFLNVFDALYDDLYRGALYTQSPVGYLELAVDSLTIPMHSFLAMAPRMRKSAIWSNDDGTKGSLCEGSFLGKTGFSMYNKAQEQLDKLGSAPFPIQTRIEAFMSGLNVSMSEISSIPNPFEKLCVMDKAHAAKASYLSAWHEFLKNATCFGTAAALQLAPSNSRRKLRQIFKANAADWWKPKEAWKALPSALTMVAPP